jgi:hypothetical protein
MHREEIRDMRRARKWLLGGGAIAAVAVVAAGVYAATHWTELQAMYAARQLRHATSDDDRTRAAGKLANLGKPGVRRLIDFIRTSEEPQRSAAVAALHTLIDAMPDNSGEVTAIALELQNAFVTSDANGQRTILAMFPDVLVKLGTSQHVTEFRGMVVDGLASPDAATRLLAIRLAIHPELNLRGEVKALLSAAEPEVRQAALFAVATAPDGELIGDEELFRWLHDPDEGVRIVCRDALVARNRTESEIAMGGRLVDPDPRERLKLLLDLRYDREVLDPEPWLERLGRDPDPAVRAGAVRVAIDVSRNQGLSSPAWVTRIAESDGDATVRRVAAFFHREATLSDPHLRPAGKE